MLITCVIDAASQAEYLREATQRVGQACAMVLHQSLGARQRAVAYTDPPSLPQLQESGRGDRPDLLAVPLFVRSLHKLDVSEVVGFRISKSSKRMNGIKRPALYCLQEERFMYRPALIPVQSASWYPATPLIMLSTRTMPVIGDALHDHSASCSTRPLPGQCCPAPTPPPAINGRYAYSRI